MKFFCIIIAYCLFASESQCSADKAEYTSSSKGNATEPKLWRLNLDINFSKTLPLIVRKHPGSEVRYKCEAVMNYTKVEKYTKNNESVETSIKQVPPDMQQIVLKNLKVYWLKNNRPLPDAARTRVTTKIDKSNGTIGTYLKIKNIDKTDEGNYSCIIKQTHEKRSVSRLEVVQKDDIENYEIPSRASLFPESDAKSNGNTETTTSSHLISENMFMEVQTKHNKTTDPVYKLEPICQEYTGRICERHLKGQYIYIPFNKTLMEIEEKLVKAIQVTKYSHDISSQCEGYALPSLCYSTFPICRDPFVTNEKFFKNARTEFKKMIEQYKEIDKYPKIVFDNLPDGPVPDVNIAEMFDFRHNSTILRRVCKLDCEILENELCQTEYAIAKRHPHIGQQLTLEDCQDLPENDADCLKIGVGTIMVSDDECYWENGSGYLGKINVAGNGMDCVPWSKQMILRIYEYPELAGRHSYCRNPGGMWSQPGCIVDKDGKKVPELCDIPKCAHKIWIYIVVVFLLLTLIILGIIICVCHKNKSKNTAIRDINLPNADKNIYGNSRLSSPMEMSELLSNQNMNNQPHLTGNIRGTGVLRVPQYSLSQIKFLEELGEGAFGKVYKGAIKNSGDTQYVAVKALKENASAKTKADFKREIDLISELTHENIVCIVGVALKEEPLCMLFEFMARGDLHEFLMGRAPPSGKGLPPMRLLTISHNIASGMQYLASHHYVHRDLAARNCLVSDDFTVKISDFGLSRDIYSSDYYRVQSKSLLPVRWMPPESILYGKFTTESDIWSYGVVLWEIYSYGLQPYYGYSNQEVIAMVRAGELLAPPPQCPPAVYSLMRDCWLPAPTRRPGFDAIVIRIQDWIANGGCPDEPVGCGRRRTETGERAPLLDDRPPRPARSAASLVDTPSTGRDTIVRLASAAARAPNEI